MCSAFYQHELGGFAVLVCISAPESLRPSTFLEYKKNFLRPIFFSVSSSVLLRRWAVLQRTFFFSHFHYLFRRFWADCVQFLVFALDQAFSHSSRGFFFNDACLIVALALPSVGLSAVCLESQSLHVLLPPFSSLPSRSNFPLFILFYVFVSRYPDWSALLASSTRSPAWFSFLEDENSQYFVLA